jgi:aryl-alcohol dehydrogenase-like predicted oxidoreductase
MFKSVQHLIEWFNEEGLPYYVICSKDGVISRNIKEKDLDTASHKLNATLERLSEDIYGQKYTVYIFSKPPNAKFNKNEADGLANFVRENKVSGTGESNTYLLNELRAQREQIAALQTQLNASLADDDDDIEKESESNVVGAIFNHPLTQGILSGLAAKFMGGESKAHAVAGVPSNDSITRIGAAIERLMAHDTELAGHLETLATIAETNPKQFKFLLGMLNNMG